MRYNAMQIFESIGRMFTGLSGDTVVGKILIGAGSILTGFYSPILLLLLTLFTFTVADMCYGIKIAHHNKKKIESRKNWKGTIVKIFDEFSILSLARLLELSVLGEQGVFVLTGGVTVIIALTELWSILENLNTLNPDGPWKALGKFLKKKGEDYIGTEIEINDEHANNSKKPTADIFDAGNPTDSMAMDGGES